ncbi:site-specific integrase [Amycolatopsis sp. NPDC051061]|uniref:tyrosine-type recombinase/integrase n=1 Tax=Amycolatopsis sp. NPDC051061 TaxID=3155042 RepID=UPI003413D428
MDGADRITAARLVVASLGVAPADLLEPSLAGSAPTFAEYIAKVERAVSPGARRTYQPYWRLLERVWSGRRLTDPTPTEIKELANHVQSAALVRRGSRGGRSAAEHFIAATRCLYRHAEIDRIISGEQNVARDVAKPVRLPSLRRALTPGQLAAVTAAAASGGTDPQLDSLLLRLHAETACRRGGALGIRSQDLDPDQCLVFLREKAGTSRWQPVSPTLMQAMIVLERQRGPAGPAAQLLRYRNGRPITRRRYDSLWSRIGRVHPWVTRQGISTHWIRHTTLTWVERNFGYAIAEAYAGHTPRATVPHATSTATYVKATLCEVATALAALTGEQHPLVRVTTPDLDRSSLTDTVNP